MNSKNVRGYVNFQNSFRGHANKKDLEAHQFRPKFLSVLHRHLFTWKTR